MLSILSFSTLLVAASGLVLYATTLAAYRVFFHPLSKYPGPLISKVTSLSVYLQASTGDRHLTSFKEHQRYGPIVRIAPNQLSFSSPAALRQIYQSARANNPLRKSPWYETIDAPSGAYSTHTEISRTKHAFRRRVLDHAFSDSSLRSSEPFVIDNANTLCKVLAKETSPRSWSKPINMSLFSTYLAYDIMGDLVFGKSFDTLTSSAHRFVPKLLMTSSAFVYPIAHLPFQWIVRPVICSERLMTWFGGQLAQDEHKYVQYANDRVAERIAKEDELKKQASEKSRKDIMHYLLSARDPITSKPFTRQDLDAESSLLIAAGADTTSTTLAATFFYLTLPTSSSILQTLQSQLRSQFPTSASITAPAITTHVYLRAVIDEVLRLAPPVPTHLSRTIVQEGGLIIDDKLIPKGTIVGCPAYVLHHDEDAFPDSWQFKPERWIPNSSSSSGSSAESESEKPPATPTQTHLSKPSPFQSPEQVSKAREAFCAFSLGSRGCVGKSLAYLELAICLGRVLWGFDIRRSQEVGVEGWTVRKDGGREEEYQLRDCFLAERDGPGVEVRLWEGAGDMRKVGD